MKLTARCALALRDRGLGAGSLILVRVDFAPLVISDAERVEIIARAESSR